jgi:hypothetical protein
LDPLEKINVTLWFKRKFIREWLDWSFQCPITTYLKFINDWEIKGACMTYCIAYLVFLYNILRSLVVNIDQIDIYLTPVAGKHTWEKCSKKDVVQIGVKNKCVTCVVSCIANGNLIPFQVVYKGETNRSLPKNLDVKRVLDHSGFTLVLSNNHWSNLHTCQQFVK